MTTTHRPADDPPIAAWQDIELALRTAESFQASIRHADAKIAALFSCVCGVAAFVAAQAGDAYRIAGGGPPFLLAAGILAVTIVTAVALAFWHLGTALRPRLTDPGGFNRFGFPCLADRAGPPPPATAERQAEEGWRFARLLARIALIKHRKVQRSIPWAFAAAAGTLAWQLLSALSSAAPGGGP